MFSMRDDMQNKSVKVKNNQGIFEIEFTKAMNLKICETIQLGFKKTDKVDINSIILSVLLEELNIPKEDWSTWSLA